MLIDRVVAPCAVGAVQIQDISVCAAGPEVVRELDASVDPSITVCAPSEFGFIDDDVCRTCPGFAECGARAIRLAAETTRESES